MNALMKPADNPITMTSLELVEFINEDRAQRAKDAGADFPSKGHAKLEHDDFMRKVPDVLKEAAPKFSGTASYTVNNAVRSRAIYNFPKREACLMAMSYSYDLQAKVFDRMTALEGGAAPALNMRDPRQMAMAALQLIEVNQELQATIDQQQHKIAADAPKVQGFDRIASSDGSLCLTDAAKTLQIQPRKLTQLLSEKCWLYRRPMGSGWLAYQERIQQGLLEHKVTTGEKSDGSEWSSTQVRVTAKGLTKLADVVRQAGLH
ncbi:MAG: phage antirepressor KilAC domain-containing protein [Simplicispira sp.]|nr:phage antirepressor KilAC domain-containing protein [Simplicispira sp.]